MFRKKTIARFQGISANSNENYRRHKFQVFGDISGNFRKIYNPIVTIVINRLCYVTVLVLLRSFCI